MQTEFLTFPQVIAALGLGVFDRLKAEFDPKIVARATDAGISDGPCILCGRAMVHQKGRTATNKRAHILPVSEGWPTTANNVVLLCERPGKATAHDGCHWLFDNGYACVNEILEVAASTGSAAAKQLASNMRTRHSTFGTSARESGHYRKWQKELRSKTGKCIGEYSKFAELILQVAESARRRTTKNALSKALLVIEEIDHAKIEDTYVRSRYLYERGYIYFLQGRWGEAHTLFLAGINDLFLAQDNPGNAWRLAAFRAMACQVQLLAHPPQIEAFRLCRAELSDVLYVLLQVESDLAIPDPWAVSSEARLNQMLAGRWAQNIHLYLCRIDVLMGDAVQARTRLEITLERWKRYHRANGWEACFKPLLVSLRGHVELLTASSDDDVRKALGFLVRALVMFRGRSQQPESISDILRGIGRGLRRLKNGDASYFFRVAERCSDAASWGLWIEERF
jgi:tetratricopeptide (TPR) repeat protein